MCVYQKYPLNRWVSIQINLYFFCNIEPVDIYILLEINSRYEDYSLFYKFFVTYSEQDFKGINPRDPLMMELDSYMDSNRQLFYITDVIQLDIKFISKGVEVHVWYGQG